MWKEIYEDSKFLQTIDSDKEITNEEEFKIYTPYIDDYQLLYDFYEGKFYILNLSKIKKYLNYLISPKEEDIILLMTLNEGDIFLNAIKKSCNHLVKYLPIDKRGLSYAARF